MRLFHRKDLQRIRGARRSFPRGQAIIEYSLIFALAAVGLMGVFYLFGEPIKGQFSDVLQELGVNQTWTPVPIGLNPQTRTAQASRTITSPGAEGSSTPDPGAAGTAEAFERTQTAAASSTVVAGMTQTAVASATAAAGATQTVIASGTAAAYATQTAIASGTAAALPTLTPTFTPTLADPPGQCVVLDKNWIWSCWGWWDNGKGPYYIFEFNGLITDFELYETQSGYRTSGRNSNQTSFRLNVGMGSGTFYVYRDDAVVARFSYPVSPVW